MQILSENCVFSVVHLDTFRNMLSGRKKSQSDVCNLEISNNIVLKLSNLKMMKFQLVLLYV